ncbi:histidine kinase [Burkholderia aenigmatica]|uniref:Histidine kinase n=1 Tax=Burkholderia aenigmatica TaxID=2015348 RepID=A0A6J5J4A5_9BURK|nr:MULTISPECIES: HAMP domain-containing protein [Burkholderia cepacia complex]AYQ43257.1 histidine kinase [Burkholderia lata]CAB3966388.1 histidine kinase [Burkholderia aenigmatica]VWC51110.1 histidine kinase [Burkholderia aenigmatica]
MRTFRIGFRGLFVKLVPTFIVVGFVAMVLSSVLTSVLWRAHAESDIRRFLGNLDRPALAAATGTVDWRDPVACRAAADALFWQIARVGARDVMDFAPMMGFFGAGRLQVRIARPDGAGCATAPAASPLLSDAFATTPADPAAPDTMLRRDGDWAIVTPVALAGGAIARIGVHYWPGWQLHYEIADDASAYDLMRTVLYLGAMGASFAGLLVWLLVRRVRRMTAAADRWAAGDLSARIADKSRDELGELAAHFNRMADALARAFGMQKALAVSVERTRIARDLHDTAKQRSFVLGLKLTELEYEAQRHPDLLPTVGAARRLADHLQQDLDNVVTGFSLPAIAEDGLRAAVSQAVHDLLAGSGIAWSLDLPAAAAHALDAHPAAAHELLMITHEAAANALRHSGCRRIDIACEPGDAVRAPSGAASSRWRWVVCDDGSGFDPAAVPTGMGLGNLRWRADALPGGMLDIASGADGTRVTVHFNPMETA